MTIPSLLDLLVSTSSSYHYFIEDQHMAFFFDGRHTLTHKYRVSAIPLANSSLPTLNFEHPDLIPAVRLLIDAINLDLARIEVGVSPPGKDHPDSPAPSPPTIS